ncbi:MAG: ribosome biogenesis GTP-binding protein YihA/YsxC [Desulfurivibrio sp.]|nr:ribosome biogenesis GTP-binding protein YihA/YsxC [Desulfurivibrio sp.]
MTAGLKIDRVTFVDSVFSPAQLPVVELPEIAFAGRSNVGKSSLINCLLRRKNLVKVSARPGKTRSLNFYLVDERLHLVDLPGYGYAKVDKRQQEQWRQLVGGYLEKRDNLRCVVVIIDLRHALKDLDRLLIQWLGELGIAFLPVYTKLDKLSRNQQHRQARLLDQALGITPEQRLLFSAKSGEGRPELWSRLTALLECEVPAGDDEARCG